MKKTGSSRSMTLSMSRRSCCAGGRALLGAAVREPVHRRRTIREPGLDRGAEGTPVRPSPKIGDLCGVAHDAGLAQKSGANQTTKALAQVFRSLTCKGSEHPACT